MTPEEQLRALKHDHGIRWEIWYVPLAGERPPASWHALEWSNADRTQVLHAYEPAHLAEYIADWENGERPE
jgi:hypothetical protein